MVARRLLLRSPMRHAVASQRLDETADSGRKARQPRLVSKSVFEVRGSLLGIGRFDRPLAEAERRSLKKAWEGAVLPEVEDFEVGAKQVAFLTHTPRVEVAWRSIDSLLAAKSS